jgi:hypothetical protein
MEAVIPRMLTMPAQTKHLQLNVLIRQEDGCWVAHCPEVNALAADPDFETAWEDIMRLCRAHLIYGLKMGKSLSDLIKPPPADLAQIIAQAEMDGCLRLHFNRVDQALVDSVIEVRRVLAQAA